MKGVIRNNYFFSSFQPVFRVNKSTKQDIRHCAIISYNSSGELETVDYGPHLPYSVPKTSDLWLLLQNESITQQLQSLNYQLIDIVQTHQGKSYAHLLGEEEWERMVEVKMMDSFIAEETRQQLRRKVIYSNLALFSQYRRLAAKQKLKNDKLQLVPIISAPPRPSDSIYGPWLQIFKRCYMFLDKKDLAKAIKRAVKRNIRDDNFWSYVVTCLYNLGSSVDGPLLYSLTDAIQKVRTLSHYLPAFQSFDHSLFPLATIFSTFFICIISVREDRQNDLYCIVKKRLKENLLEMEGRTIAGCIGALTRGKVTIEEETLKLAWSFLEESNPSQLSPNDWCFVLEAICTEGYTLHNDSIEKLKATCNKILDDSSYTGANLSTFAKALASFQVEDKILWRRLLSHFLPLLSSTSPRSLCDMIKATADMSLGQESFFRLSCDALLRQSKQLGVKDAIEVLYALGKRGVYFCDLETAIYDLCTRRLGALSPQEGYKGMLAAHLMKGKGQGDTGGSNGKDKEREKMINLFFSRVRSDFEHFRYDVDALAKLATILREADITTQMFLMRNAMDCTSKWSAYNTFQAKQKAKKGGMVTTKALEASKSHNAIESNPSHYSEKGQQESKRSIIPKGRYEEIVEEALMQNKWTCLFKDVPFANLLLLALSLMNNFSFWHYPAVYNDCRLLDGQMRKESQASFAQYSLLTNQYALLLSRMISSFEVFKTNALTPVGWSLYLRILALSSQVPFLQNKSIDSSQAKLSAQSHSTQLSSSKSQAGGARQRNSKHNTSLTRSSLLEGTRQLLNKGVHTLIQHNRSAISRIELAKGDFKTQNDYFALYDASASLLKSSIHSLHSLITAGYEGQDELEQLFHSSFNLMISLSSLSRLAYPQRPLLPDSPANSSPLPLAWRQIMSSSCSSPKPESTSPSVKETFTVGRRGRLQEKLRQQRNATLPSRSLEIPSGNEDLLFYQETAMLTAKACEVFLHSADFVFSTSPSNASYWRQKTLKALDLLFFQDDQSSNPHHDDKNQSLPFTALRGVQFLNAPLLDELLLIRNNPLAIILDDILLSALIHNEVTPQQILSSANDISHELSEGDVTAKMENTMASHESLESGRQWLAIHLLTVLLRANQGTTPPASLSLSKILLLLGTENLSNLFLKAFNEYLSKVRDFESRGGHFTREDSSFGNSLEGIELPLYEIGKGKGLLNGEKQITPQPFKREQMMYQREQCVLEKEVHDSILSLLSKSSKREDETREEKDCQGIYAVGRYLGRQHVVHGESILMNPLCVGVICSKMSIGNAQLIAGRRAREKVEKGEEIPIEGYVKERALKDYSSRPVREKSFEELQEKYPGLKLSRSVYNPQREYNWEHGRARREEGQRLENTFQEMLEKEQI